MSAFNRGFRTRLAEAQRAAVHFSGCSKQALMSHWKGALQGACAKARRYEKCKSEITTSGSRSHFLLVIRVVQAPLPHSLRNFKHWIVVHWSLEVLGWRIQTCWMRCERPNSMSHLSTLKSTIPASRSSTHVTRARAGPSPVPLEEAFARSLKQQAPVSPIPPHQLPWQPAQMPATARLLPGRTLRQISYRSGVSSALLPLRAFTNATAVVHTLDQLQLDRSQTEQLLVRTPSFFNFHGPSQ